MIRNHQTEAANRREPNSGLPLLATLTRQKTIYSGTMLPCNGIASTSALNVPLCTGTDALALNSATYVSCNHEIFKTAMVVISPDGS